MSIKNLVSGKIQETARKLASNPKMQEIAGYIMTHSLYDPETKKIYSPVSGKAIGWYDPNLCTGWCSLQGYKELCKASEEELQQGIANSKHSTYIQQMNQAYAYACDEDGLYDED